MEGFRVKKSGEVFVLCKCLKGGHVAENMVLKSFSTEATEDIGSMVAKKVGQVGVIALWGQMGAGKTAFTRGVSKVYGLEDMVSSPTFSIVNEYKNESVTIYHFDMYRIESTADLESTGYYDYLEKALLVIEWSENIREVIPQEAINVFIEQGQRENERIIKIEGIEI